MFVRTGTARLTDEVTQGYTQEGWTLARTAEACGLSVSSTWAALRRHGIMTRPNKVLRLLPGDVMKARKGQVTGVELAKKYRVTTECVNRHLRRMGVDPVPRVKLALRRSLLVNGARARAPRDKVFSLRAKGMTLRQMGRRLGVSYERVRQILSEGAA